MSIFDQIASLGTSFQPVTAYAQGRQMRSQFDQADQQSALQQLQMQQMNAANKQAELLSQLRGQLAISAPESRVPIIESMFAIDPQQGQAAKKFYGIGGGEGGAEYGYEPIYALDKTGNIHAFQLSKTAGPREVSLGDGLTPVRPLSFGDAGDRLVGRNAFTGSVVTELQKQLSPEKSPGYIVETEVAKAKGQKMAGGTPLSSTAEKELFEADSMVQAGQGVEGAISKALQLNDQSYSGYGAGVRAKIRSNLPGQSEAADSTVLLDSLIKEQLLGSMKTIFGANPTEGERTILLELGASTEKTPPQREAILRRALEAARNRVNQNAAKAQALRQGTYFTEGVPQPNAVSDLSGHKENPRTIKSDTEYNALPSGALFVGPDGKQRRKP